MTTPRPTAAPLATPATLALTTLLLLAGCGSSGWPTFPDPERTLASLEAEAAAAGLVVRSIPAEDPGPPFYARVGLQLLHQGDLLAIPLYRDPACIPHDFNLLEMFDFPGPTSPGAFACPLTLTGKLMIEPEATLGTFPRRVVLLGDAVRFWFVPLEAFEAAAQDGVVTFPELAALSPMEGTATRYHEDLHPRDGDHRIHIDAEGRMDDGRRFRFHAAHIDDELRSIRIRIE
jgi:hypothetical protein